MKMFTFFVKYVYWNASKVSDSLSRRCLVLYGFKVGTFGFENIKEMYKEDPTFKEDYESYENRMLRDKIPWIEYMNQEGLMFKGSQLCILKCSMRYHLLKEKQQWKFIEPIYPR